MKKLLCLVEVPDKYTREIYKVDNVYEFEDERADEILRARTKVTQEPYFEEYVEEVTEEVVQAVATAIVEEAEENDKSVEEVVTEIVEEQKPKRGRKSTKK